MAVNANYTLQHCSNCGHIEDVCAKFCSSCGTLRATASISLFPEGNEYADTYYDRNQGTPTRILPENFPSNFPAQAAEALTHVNDRHVPNFAHVRKISPEQAKQRNEELAKLLVLLARERVFLVCHWILFLFFNILGFVISLKCYNEFVGDEMTKCMVASTPFLFINLVALCCLIPIKGTREQIVRLKEEISHWKFRMSYGFPG